MGLCSYTQQSSPRTKDHRASPQTIIHLSTLYQPGFSAPMRWKHTPYMEHHLPQELALTELIHGSHRDITMATTFVRHSEDSSTWLTLNLAPIPLVRTLDTTYLHNGMILSTLGLSHHGFVFGLYPKRPHTNGDICPSLYTHDPSHL